MAIINFLDGHTFGWRWHNLFSSPPYSLPWRLQCCQYPSPPDSNPDRVGVDSRPMDYQKKRPKTIFYLNIT
ncbi:hypothetical protein DVH24_008608 [Malus domestica]|uniref:Uncharacterized protein n=1 Tax=Malus domestica TaxID=3750 RepID=A0A498JK50_MALDO|nr:hypothetical protein DVH24_008608 [Malus domestica]